MPDPLQEALNPTEPFDPDGEQGAAPQPAAPAEQPVEPGPATPHHSQEQPRDPDTQRFVRPSAHSAGMRQRARDLLYLEDSQIDALDSATLTHLVVGAQERLLHETRQLAQQRIVANTSPAADTPTPDPGDNFGIDPQTGELRFDPVLSAEIVALRKKIRDLEGVTKETAEREQLRQQRTTTALVDEAFEALGQQNLFGNGSIGEMPATAGALARRLAVYTQAGINLDIDTPRVIAKKIKDTAALLYPAAPKAAENAYAEPTPQPKAGKAKPTVEEWNDGAVARPTNRVANEMPLGKERAIRNLAQRRAQQAAESDAGLNGVPE